MLRDTRLDEVFTSLENVAGLLDYLEARVSPCFSDGDLFPCLIYKGQNATILRTPSGELRYATFRPSGRMCLVCLGEVLGHLHGYRWPDERIGRWPHLLGLFNARLAVDSGVIEIRRRKLPLLPPSIRKQLVVSDHRYLSLLVESFALRLDLAEAFTPMALQRATGHIMFSHRFRERWIREQHLTKRDRRAFLWKLLVREGFLVAVPWARDRRVPLYRFAELPRSRQLPSGLTEGTDRRVVWLSLSGLTLTGQFDTT